MASIAIDKKSQSENLPQAANNGWEIPKDVGIETIRILGEFSSKLLYEVVERAVRFQSLLRLAGSHVYEAEVQHISSEVTAPLE